MANGKLVGTLVLSGWLSFALICHFQFAICHFLGLRLSAGKAGFSRIIERMIGFQLTQELKAEIFGFLRGLVFLTVFFSQLPTAIEGQSFD